MHAIGRVYPFVCLFVFTPYHMNQLTCDFDFACTWTLTVDHSSPRIESRGHRSKTQKSVVQGYLVQHPMNIH